MKIANYEQFVQAVQSYLIFPFSGFVPDYPSLAAAASDLQWHTGEDTDPWLWRVRIVNDGNSAYGKFIGPKAAFVHVSLFPLLRVILSNNRTADERYADGLMSAEAYRIYKIMSDCSDSMDARQLRKEAGMNEKEHKKAFEQALVELQNSADLVIAGTYSQSKSGWSSMRYDLSDRWLAAAGSVPSLIPLEEAKERMRPLLENRCTEKAYRYMVKKMGL